MQGSGLINPHHLFIIFFAVQKEKNVFEQYILNLHGLLRAFFLCVNKSTCCKVELHLTISETCTILFQLNSIGFIKELISKA